MLETNKINDAIQLWKKVFCKTSFSDIGDYAIGCMLVGKEYQSISLYLDDYAVDIAEEIDLAVPTHLHDYTPDQWNVRDKLSSILYQRVVRIMHYVFNFENAEMYIYNPCIRVDISNVNFCEVELW